MFVVSISKKYLVKMFLVCLSVLACVVVAFVVPGMFTGASINTDGRVSTMAENEDDILQFVSSLGWEVDESPVEIRQVVIPEHFDEVYTKYNEIQMSQGFDLKRYAGVSVKRWTYTIRNYPGTTPEDEFIRINLLVYNGEIIGGDVCSIKLDGFMHGFYKE